MRTGVLASPVMRGQQRRLHSSRLARSPAATRWTDRDAHEGEVAHLCGGHGSDGETLLRLRWMSLSAARRVSASRTMFRLTP